MESFHVHIEPFCGGHVSHDLNTGRHTHADHFFHQVQTL